MVVIGIGCRRGAEADAIVAAIASVGVPADALATARFKQDEPGIGQAATRLGLPLRFVGEAEMEAAADRAPSASDRVRDLVGVASVAEAAALAAAGPGSRLIAGRMAIGGVTCAAAEGEGGA